MSLSVFDLMEGVPAQKRVTNTDEGVGGHLEADESRIGRISIVWDSPGIWDREMHEYIASWTYDTLEMMEREGDPCAEPIKELDWEPANFITHKQFVERELAGLATWLSKRAKSPESWWFSVEQYAQEQYNSAVRRTRARS